MHVHVTPHQKTNCTTSSANSKRPGKLILYTALWTYHASTKDEYDLTHAKRGGGSCGTTTNNG